MYCLWCDQAIIPEISWENIFLLTKPKQLCDLCENTLEKIGGMRCKYCSRQSEVDVCSDCLWWKSRSRPDPLLFNHSIFTYNEQMQAMVTRWKYRGDYHLTNAFKETMIQSFNKVFSFLSKNVWIVPIPLSEERLLERGFNQAKVLAACLPAENKDILTRIHSEKQSKKTRSERLSADNPFVAAKKVNKPVILVDDIYTTGTTLRHAATLLKEQGCPEVYAYTLIRG